MSQIEKNVVKLGPSQSFILYPALTSPALVRGDGTLNIIIAGDEALLKYCQTHSPGYDSGQELSEQALRFMYSHLLLVKWRDLMGEPKDIDNNSLLKDVQEGSFRFVKGKAYQSSLREIANTSNMLYEGEGQAAPVQRAGKTCRGWYLTTLTPKEYNYIDDDGATKTMYGTFYNAPIYDQGNTDEPFGILAPSVVSFLHDEKRTHIFQLSFSDITAFNTSSGAKGMWELLWLAEVVEKDKPKRIVNPGEEAFQKLFAQTIATGGGKRKKPLLAPASPTAQCDDVEKRRCAGSFALPGLGEGEQSGESIPDTPEKEITNLAATFQKGRLYGPRHPVFWSNKKRLDVNMIADPHISSRQSIYKVSGARLIHGIDNLSGGIPKSKSNEDNTSSPPVSVPNAPIITPPVPSDSPLIGRMTHEYITSTTELYKNSSADIVAFLGDMYDHIRNCSPIAYRDRASGTAWQTAGYMWEAMSYKENYKSDYDLYPRYIDALLTLELIYEGYSKKLPTIFCAGNHEGYEHPYGVSPRVWGEENGFKGNDGIPLDHNLTFMEIIQLFGPSYHEHHGSGNFQGHNFNWLYTTFSPWKDIFISYNGNPKKAGKKATKDSAGGGEQNFVVLDWGRGEKFFTNIAVGDTLPVAKDAVQKSQLALIERAGKKHAANNAVSNLLLSHFTFASYTRGKALYGDHYAKKGFPLPKSKEELKLRIEKSRPLKDGASIDIGTFEDNQVDAWRIVTKHFEATLSGHTHKAGVYEISVIEEGTPNTSTHYFRHIQPFFTTALLEKTDKKEDNTIPLPPNDTLAYSLVSGSCGSYNKQNLFGELGGYGFEKPQSMVVRFDDASGRLESAEIVRAKKCGKPKLSVTMDYLWEDGKRLFETLRHDVEIENSHETWNRSSEDKRIYEGVILALGPNQPLTFRCTEKLCDYFRITPGADTTAGIVGAATGSTVDIVKTPRFPLPGKTINIHAVHYPDEGDPMHMGCLTLTINHAVDYSREYSFASQRGGRVFTLNGTGETIAQFVAHCTARGTISIDRFQFVLSVVFDSLVDGELNFTKYNTAIPWSFPVEIDCENVDGVTVIKRPSEIPNFSFFWDNYPAEYKKIKPS